MWKTVRAKKSMQLVTHPKKKNKWYIHGFKRESPPDRKVKEYRSTASCSVYFTNQEELKLPDNSFIKIKEQTTKSQGFLNHIQSGL